MCVTASSAHYQPESHHITSKNFPFAIALLTRSFPYKFAVDSINIHSEATKPNPTPLVALLSEVTVVVSVAA